MKYKKGDIVIVKYPFADLATYKKRPALIISNDTVNKTGDYLMVMVTSKIKNDGLSLPLMKNDFIDSNELPLTSFVRTHKIFLINDSLIISKINSVSVNFLDKIKNKIIDIIK